MQLNHWRLPLSSNALLHAHGSSNPLGAPIGGREPSNKHRSGSCNSRHARSSITTWSVPSSPRTLTKILKSSPRRLSLEVRPSSIGFEQRQQRQRHSNGWSLRLAYDCCDYFPTQCGKSSANKTIIPSAINIP